MAFNFHFTFSYSSGGHKGSGGNSVSCRNCVTWKIDWNSRPIITLPVGNSPSYICAAPIYTGTMPLSNDSQIKPFWYTIVKR